MAQQQNISLAQICITCGQAQGSKKTGDNILPMGKVQFTITKMTAAHSYLLQLAAFGAHEGQRVVLIDVGDDRSHAVSVLCEDRNATYHLGHAQGGVHIQATEIIING